MFSFLLIAATAYGGLIALMFIFQRNLMYHPAVNLAEPDFYGVPEMRVVTLKTSDSLHLTAWFTEAKDGRKTIVYLHGNGGHIGHRATKVKPYLAAGYGLLLVSYRGYGDNPGTPTEENLIEDGMAGMRFLASTGVPSGQIILYGESLGTGVAAAVAQRNEIAAVILEAPFTSVADVSQHHYFYVPARYLVKDRFDTSKRIKNLQAPLLIIHGERDGVIPWKLGRALFDLAPEPKFFLSIPKATHNNLYDFGVALSVIDFMEGRTAKLLNN